MSDLSSTPNSTPSTPSTPILDQLQNDPAYHYLKRGTFTTELHKLELKGLPRHVGFSEMKNFMKSKEITCHKIKLIPSRGKNCNTQCYVTFADDEQKEAARKKLNEIGEFKSRNFTVHDANPHKDPHEKLKEQRSEKDLKRANKEFRREERIKLRKTEDGATGNDFQNNQNQRKQNSNSSHPTTNPLDKIAAYHMHDYQTQINKKQKSMQKVCENLHKQMIKNYPPHFKNKEFVAIKQRKKENRNVFHWDLNPVVQDPNNGKIGYRNKCEFTVGYDESYDKIINDDDGQKIEDVSSKIVVGFRGSSYKDRPNLVLDLNHRGLNFRNGFRILKHITEKKNVITDFEENCKNIIMRLDNT